ncbi:54S ribosomal protein L4, mitochondrial [Smittium culicis]|uniref:Large ribosomal subunit protein uL29m n=1 Tax=Smittium culicis TaxID=133412 RepID=A0A1R1YF41_9FUNG|nr:54S ribosomal protein L4, mitochondrial [Smittium culicis]
MFSMFKNAFQGLTTRRINLPAFKPRGLEEFFENSEALPKEKVKTGRAWRAAELRNKSWEDLQKLWFVLLKERNLLATQKAEALRFRINAQFFSNTSRIVKCKQSMARIKSVLNERRLAYEKSIRISKHNRYLEFKNSQQEASKPQ